MKYIITIKDTHIVGDEKESSELMKTGGLWCISMSQLTAIVEGTP